MTARDDILRRLEAPRTPVAESYAAIDRSYRRAHHSAGLVDLFVERVEDYKATVRRVSADGLPAEIARAVSGREGPIGVPAGLPEEWLAETDASRLVRNPPVDARALDRLGGVVTGCAVAIAETGTVVLDHGPGQGARALTLVPDYHLVVVAEDQIAADVPGALERIVAVRPLTFVSGPSATSDIELSRVEGVHGPRTLDVLLVS